MTHPRKQRIIDIYGKEPDNLDELAHCVIKVIESQYNCQPCTYQQTGATNLKVVGFAWDLKYGLPQFRRHHPVESNRERDSKYLGWSGRVWIRYEELIGPFGSDPFNMTMTYTGTGGRGGYSGPWDGLSTLHYNKPHKDYSRPIIYSWDYQLFDNDWPNLSKSYLFDIMQGTTKNMKHCFIWEDPATKQLDQEFIKTQQN